MVSAKKTPDIAFWKGKHVLVTGHTGFKGGWLVQWLASMGAEVTGVSLAPTGEINLFTLNRLDEMCDHHIADLRNSDLVNEIVTRANPQIVLHLAAQALVRSSIKDPVSTIATNVMGTVHLLEALRGCADLKAVLSVTSDKVYVNANTNEAFVEAAPLGGKDPYSASKAAQDIIVQSYRQCFFEPYGVNLATVRGGNVIGGGDFSDDRIIPDAVRSIEEGEPLVLRHPEATRPWQHVLDCINGYLLFAEHLATAETFPPALNIGPDAEDENATVGELVDTMFDIMDVETRWYHEPVPGSLEAKTLALNNKAAKETLGWQDYLTGRSKITETATWYKAYLQREDMRSVTDSQIQKFIA